MPRTVLDDLPADLAFLAPCVRAMLVVRAGFRPSVDPDESPEEAADEETEQCGKQYEAILQEALERRFSKIGARAFQHRVNAFRDSLWKWLNSYHECDTPEMAMLFTIAGTVPQPKRTTLFQRLGSLFGRPECTREP